MDCAYTHAMRPYKVPRPNAHPCASSRILSQLPDIPPSTANYFPCFYYILRRFGAHRVPF